MRYYFRSEHTKHGMRKNARSGHLAAKHLATCEAAATQSGGDKHSALSMGIRQ